MQDHAAFALLLDPSLQSEKNTDGWQKIRLIFGLAELSRKLKKNCGSEDSADYKQFRLSC